MARGSLRHLRRKELLEYVDMLAERAKECARKCLETVAFNHLRRMVC